MMSVFVENFEKLLFFFYSCVTLNVIAVYESMKLNGNKNNGHISSFDALTIRILMFSHSFRIKWVVFRFKTEIEINVNLFL